MIRFQTATGYFLSLLGLLYLYMSCVDEKLNCMATYLGHWAISLRPSSDAVLHMSRIEFDELNSCAVRHLNQF